ncbi:MAG TPA: hypothetical protein VJT67_01515 [Longimicrobiaceae bacterium]|nr:hypothetical protein [Longimicrobiaceae bacterium]
MKRSALILAAVLVPAFACDKAPTSASQRQGGNIEVRRTGTANASVVAAYRLSSGYTLGVVASNNGSSVTTGTAALYSQTGDVAAAITITCISKSGGHAKLSGTVNESSDPSIEGMDAYFEVNDAAIDQANTVNLAAAGTGPTCLQSPEYDLANISAGTIIVS